MTSGTFQTFPVSSIWVNREKRQRRDLTDIEELAESISRIGLIHPPVIRKNGELIVGERRWTAIKLLGWTHLPIQFIEDLSEHELRRVELEENIRRKDIPWQNQCLAVLEYHTLRSTEPDWSAEKTADFLGTTPQDVRQKIQIAKEVERGNNLVATAPKFSTARNYVQRQNERKRASEISNIIEKPIEIPILNVDFNEWAKTYDGPKFNFLHCDFPYGVNFNKMDGQSSTKDFGEYQDDPKVYWNLLLTLHTYLDTLIDTSAHLIFWFSMEHYAETKRALEDMGWKLDKRPLIWFRSDNSGILPDSNRGPRWVYETAFFGSRGDRKIVQAVANCVAAPSTKEYHPTEKPLAVLQHFFRMTCDETTRTLDPTCGSGNSIIVSGNGRGLEKDRQFYERACENYRKNGPQFGDGTGGPAGVDDGPDT